MLLLPDVSWCDWKMRERPPVDATEPLLPASFLPLAEERSTGFQALPLAQPQEGYPEPAPPKLEHLRNDGSHRWKTGPKPRRILPWLVWLSGWSTGLQTKGLLVRFLVR